MKYSELEKYIKNQSTSLYSFAYTLIPDDLQATQLMIDSVSTFLIVNGTHELKNISSNQDDEFEEKLILTKLYKHLYEISKKRFIQLESSLKNSESEGPFFKLNLDEKAVMFLNEKAEFRMEEIAFVLSKTQYETQAILLSSRMNLMNELPDLVGSHV